MHRNLQSALALHQEPAWSHCNVSSFLYKKFEIRLSLEAPSSQRLHAQAL